MADAEAMVRAGRVFVGGAPVVSPRARVPAGAALVIEPPRELRGTIKLRAALDAFGVAIAGRTAVDLGASTGGFTLELLRRGAARVYAVDAGYGQLLGSLRQDPRVVNLERRNLADVVIPEPAGVVTVDLAYLAIARAAPQIARLPLAAGADLVALVKPMFELGLASAPTDDASLEEARRRAAAGLAAHGFAAIAAVPSPIAGARGARELFLHARLQCDATPGTLAGDGGRRRHEGAPRAEE
ncbi:MAG TPA: SAM-dependent methyltransferase [Haliangiales bacterium]|nr:SAM-dependent methyltransferase [Haliangiales bacterium]